MAPRNPPADKPDIILITAANIPLGLTGFGGNKAIRTPNLDRLAAESACFTRFYVVTPQAGPGRATLLTGQYPPRHGVTMDGEPLSLSADTVTDRLASAGYRCGLIGPWNLGGVATSRPAFGFRDYPATTSQPWSWQNCDVWVDGKRAKAGGFLPDWLTGYAIEWLARADDRPVFLWVCYPALGEQATSPPDGDKLYPPASLELPVAFRTPLTDRPSAIGMSPPARKFQSLNEQKIREERSRYFSMLTHFDAQVGRLLDWIDRVGLRERAAVVFTAETGWAIGEHQLVGAGPAFYDEIVRCPLLIRRPGPPGRGLPIDRVTSQVHVAPTILQLAGLTVPVTMQGASLLPLVDNPRSDHWTDEAFFAFERQDDYFCQVRGAVIQNYKYLDYGTGTDGLYDLKADPEELYNAAQVPEYRSVMNVLGNRLRHWQHMTRDPTYKKPPL
ncbi:MAG TPA: sulfatase-like hydrolase/transferase [Phycisphaerae bacterium]|nr:sulfatase-like hydrolase/transferase [Phycisphaerae bacterium]